MKKVLVVAHYFPPVGGAGVQRAAKFVKYLPEFGWEPIVLTSENPSVPVFDESLLGDIPPEASIFRTRTLEPSYGVKESLGQEAPSGSRLKTKAFSCFRSLVKSVLLPDLQVLWWPHTAWTMFKLLKEKNIDVVFATAPPFSVLVLATFVGRLRKVPVVIDFRDEWVFARETLEQSAKGWWPKFVDYWMERLVVRHSSCFIAATQSYVDSICGRHPEKKGCKGKAITNGFDEDDFNGIYRSRIPDGNFRITYVGTLWRATSLLPFIRAVEVILSRNQGLHERLEIQIYGRVVGDELNHIKRLDGKCNLSVCGYINHSDVLQEMVNSDLLLLTLSDLPGANRIIPGKTFEYIASSRPIFAIIPNGETANIVREVQNVKGLVHPNDLDGIVLNLEKTIQSFFEGQDHENYKNESRYTRFELTGSLAKIFDETMIRR